MCNLYSETKGQAASDGSHGVPLVYYAFDLLHLDGRDIARLPLGERKALLQPLVTGRPGIQFNEHIASAGENVRKHACGLGLEGIVVKSRPITTPPKAEPSH